MPVLLNLLVPVLLIFAFSSNFCRAAITERAEDYLFTGANHAISISKENGSIVSITGGNGLIATGDAGGFWTLILANNQTLNAAALLADAQAVFTVNQTAQDQLRLAYSNPEFTVDIQISDRVDGLELRANVSSNGRTVQGVGLPVGMRFSPDSVQRLIAPNHSSDGVGMAWNPAFFQIQTEDNAATWKRVSQADGGAGYRSLHGGAGLVFENSEPVPLGFTSNGVAWLGNSTATSWNGTMAVVNRPPAAGQWDLLLIDSPKGPYFSGSKLGGGSGAGHMFRIGGNVNGQTAINRSLDLVSAAIDHLAKTPSSRTRIAVLSMERGPVIGVTWPSEVRVDEWLARLRTSTALLHAGIEVVEIPDMPALEGAAASGDFLAILNPYGELLPASLSGGVAASVATLRSYVHGGGNWFEVGGHPFFFALQPELFYSVELPYPAAFADFLQLETMNGSAAVFGVQNVLSDPSNPWTPGNLFVPGQLTWGADSLGGYLGRSFVAWIPDGQAWQSPPVRLVIGHNSTSALAAYSAANGFNKGLEDKMPPPLLEKFKKSVLVRAFGNATQLTNDLAGLPSPSILHFTQYLKGGFDKEYPDHLPPNPLFGTPAEFQSFLSASKNAGVLTMPYTNPTFWGDHPKGPTFLSTGDAPLVRNPDGSLAVEEYFGETGYAASPWHPATQAANRRTIDLFTPASPGNVPDETHYPVDLFFQDQIGARSWQYDLNTASPAATAYMHGLAAIAAEDSLKLPLSTENGFDRLINFHSQFCGLAWGLAPTPGAPVWRRYLRERYDPAVWNIFPLAQHLAHDKVAFTYNNLGASTAHDEAVTWALALGYGMTYMLDVGDLQRTPKREWLRWIDRLQKSVVARFTGQGVNSFNHLWGAGYSNGEIQATYGPVEIHSNLDAVSKPSGARTLAPHGFVAKAPGLVAARILDPYALESVNFVAETNASGGCDFWVHSRGNRTVSIELPSGFNGQVATRVESGNTYATEVSNNILLVSLPAGASPSESYLWQGSVDLPFLVTLTPKGTATIDDYTGPGGAVTIPSTFNGRPVTAIRNDAFNGDASITFISLPEGLLTIGNHTFFGCVGLVSVDIPSTVTSIGTAAFQNCSSLVSIDIPNSVGHLGDYAFYGCTALQALRFGTQLTTIGTGAFQNCASLESIFLPDNITSIGEYAFHGCINLTALQGGRQLGSIGTAAFATSTNLQNITFLGNAPSLGPTVFPQNLPVEILHLHSTSGWTNPWNGFGTKIWKPAPANPRIEPEGFTFDLTGPESVAISIEATDNLMHGTWEIIDHIVLPSSIKTFTDKNIESTKFYRINY